MITIAYFTSRRAPMWEWFFDSLALQTDQADRANLQIIVVDFHAWANGAQASQVLGYSSPTDTYAHINRDYSHIKSGMMMDVSRQKELAEAVDGRFNIRHLPPKPTVWQGPFRLTKKDWFAASNARNTALIAADGDYFVGVDDLSVLVPGWFDQVKHAATGGYCVCGAYKKVKNLLVNSGHIDAFTHYPEGVDSRWNRGSDTGIVPASGSWLFGCSFGIPLHLAIYINGFDEICDGQSAEDYDFGIRAERAGGQFFYNRNMLTLESEERHHIEPSFARDSKLVTPDRLPEGYKGNPMSDHVLLHSVARSSRTRSLGTLDIKNARADFKAFGGFSTSAEPTTDWRDGTPISAY